MKLYSHQRAFLAEANKLMKPPAVMSNRELVELFVGGLSLTMDKQFFSFWGDQQRKRSQTRGKRPKSEI